MKRPDKQRFFVVLVGSVLGRVLYDKVAESSEFQSGLARLEKGLGQYRVAMLCAEEDPAGCHRRLLVGRVLAQRGITVEHIRSDGRLADSVFCGK